MTKREREPARLEIDKGRILNLVPTPDGYPSALTICNRRWHVYYSPDLVEYGLTWPVKHAIVIASEQDPESMADTLLHEALHACFLMADSTKGREGAVTALAPFLLSLLRSNRPWW